MKQLTTAEWKIIHQRMNAKGYAHVPQFITPQQCEELQRLYGEPQFYRNTINMQRYRFGSGEYKYFSYPLPALLQQIREHTYPYLATLANEWMSHLKIDLRYPLTHAEFISHCHERKQSRPTPLILRYREGGYNTLHQDLYGDVYFPFQLVIVLTQPQRDHWGGELVLTEQVPRAQSRAEVIAPGQGDAVIFTTNFRPVQGTRGYYRTTMKHGVSEIRKGERFALGIIFHDAA